MKRNAILTTLIARRLRRFSLDLLCNSWFWRLFLGILVWLVVSLLGGQVGLDAIAQSPLPIQNEPQNEPQDESQAEERSTDAGTTFIPALSPQYPPPELNWLQPGAVPPDTVITSATISPTGLTPPSLWWTDQQFGGKTLKGWIAYPGTETLPPRVDLVVNRQLWGLSDYLERYSFVHHFGRAAQSFGYTIRVFNDVGEPLAIYPCPINPCAIIINSSGIGVLQDNDPFSTF